jgi:hypothetical protein
MANVVSSQPVVIGVALAILQGLLDEAANAEKSPAV